MKELENKSILLIALHEYSGGIIEQLKNMGAKVDYICDKPNDGVVCKTLGRLKFKPYIHIIEQYYTEQISKISNTKYDYILVIRGEYTPVNTLKELKAVFKRAKLILYMWDSLKNNKGIELKWPYYDKVYTFDRIDYLAHQDQIFFLPLFYYNSYLPKKKSEKYKYDIAFIGTGHEDRVKIIKGIQKECQKYGLKMFSYIFLPHPLIFIKNKLFNKFYRNVSVQDIHFELLPTQKAYQIYALSKCVIDIESPTQCGLTMRTIEMIGLKKKLITTNKDIINYDFYNPNNIMVVDRKNFKINKEFADTPYVKLEDEIYKKYSLRGWLLQVLNVDSREGQVNEK